MSASIASRLTRLTLTHLLLGFAVLSGLLLSLSWLVARPASINVGESDATLSGFYAPEVGPQSRYRWTGASSAIAFPGIGASAWQMEITFATQRAPGVPPPVVEIYSGPDLLARFNPLDPGFQTYTVDTLIRTNMLTDVALEIRTAPTYSPSGEPRDLGIAVDRIALAPRALILPSIWHLALLMLAVILFVFALQIIGGRICAIIGGTILSCTLALLMAWDRMWVTPFSAYLPILAAILAALALAHQAVVRFYLQRQSIETLTQQVQS